MEEKGVVGMLRMSWEMKMNSVWSPEKQWGPKSQIFGGSHNMIWLNGTDLEDLQDIVLWSQINWDKFLQATYCTSTVLSTLFETGTLRQIENEAGDCATCHPDICVAVHNPAARDMIPFK